MPRFFGAVSGLLMFSAMILRGLSTGNPVAVVLSRALVGLFVGVALGAVVGWVAQRVIDEHVASAGAVDEQSSAPASESPPKA